MDMTCVPGSDVPEAEDYDPYSFQNYTAISLPDPIPTPVMATKVTFYIIAFLVDIIGNSIVILIIVLNKRMKSTTNVLLLNLAISDLMVGCFCMWVHLGNSITTEWPFGEYVCKGNIFMQVVAVTSSVLTLTAISVERFFAIVFPLKKCKSSVTTAVIVVTNWILAIGIAMPHLVVRKTFEYYWSNRHEVWCDEFWPQVYTADCHMEMPARVIYYTVVCVVMYFIPIFVMVCAYTVIVVTMIVRKRPGSLVTSSRQIQDKSRRKVIKMLIAVLCSFIICWTPQQSLILWDIYRPRNEKPKDYVLKVKYAALFMAYLNSALNPILYGGFNENFRKGFRDAFKCFLWKKRNAVFPVNAERHRHTSNLGTPNTTPIVTSTI